MRVHGSEVDERRLSTSKKRQRKCAAARGRFREPEGSAVALLGLTRRAEVTVAVTMAVIAIAIADDDRRFRIDPRRVIAASAQQHHRQQPPDRRDPVARPLFLLVLGHTLLLVFMQVDAMPTVTPASSISVTRSQPPAVVSAELQLNNVWPTRSRL
jgi:hypothetical protein